MSDRLRAHLARARAPQTIAEFVRHGVRRGQREPHAHHAPLAAALHNGQPLTVVRRMEVCLGASCVELGIEQGPGGAWFTHALPYETFVSLETLANALVDVYGQQLFVAVGDDGNGDHDHHG